MNMAEEQPLLEEWRELFRLAGKIREIAPWNLMDETDVFGVRNPETGELGFVSVMGMEDMHSFIALYRGNKALYDFWDFHDAAAYDLPEQIMEIPQLQVAFENRDLLDEKDYALIKKLNLKFRGKNAWPKFRSIRSGYLPWYISGDEARFLIYALEQIIDVAGRFEEDEYLLDLDEDMYLVRIPVKKGNSMVWEDRIMEIPPPDLESIPIRVDKGDLETLRNIPHGDMIFEIDFFIFPAKIGEKNQRPLLPYMLMVVESKSGMIAGHETFVADPSLEEMWGKVPGVLVHQFSKTRILPGEIRVRSGLLYVLLQPIAEELKFRLRHYDILPGLDEAKQTLFHFML
jgi:hypothetical protein